MGRYSIVAAGLLLFSCGLAIAEGLDYADKLAVLSDVRLRDQAQTAKRYRYVLPRMAERCADLPNGERAADLMVKAHQLIDEAGVTEPIPRLVERLYLLFAEVAPAAERAQIPLKCSEVAAFYVIARREGAQPDEALEGVAALVNGIYSVATVD